MPGARLGCYIDSLIKCWRSWQERPEREHLTCKVSECGFHLQGNGELPHLLRPDLYFWMFALVAVVGNEFGKEEMGASSPRRKVQRTKRAMECQSCWRNFPQKRALASVLHPLQVCQRAAHQQTLGSLYICLFMVCSLALLHQSVLLLLAHTNMQTHWYRSSPKILFFQLSFLF